MDFSEVERFAQHFDDPKRDAWQQPEEVVRLMNISAGQRVADIGAGTGYFVPYLSRAVGPTGKVLALDVELNMVRHLERRVRDQALRNVEPVHVPPGDPELAGGSVDRILIVNTWHHIGQRSAYAAKLARALKRGGSIWVVDFTLDSDIGPPSEHRLSPAQVATELSSAGLRAEIIRDEALPKQYVVQGSLVGDSE
jgi:ubiquinone/menaquinone biosynthesis C-methylase UbiE